MVRLHPILPALLLALAPSLAFADDTPGCGKAVPSADIGSTRKLSIISSNANRTFYVHLPRDYESDDDYPVIIGFHGAPGIGPHFEADTRFSAPRWGDDKIMVYPDALGGIWATGMPGAVTTPVDQDLKFMSDLLDYLRNNYCVDNEKIYATGISNGGGFLNRIACDPVVGANFAAFAPDAGAYTGFEAGGNATCNPYKTPIPIISFHGTNDTTVPYNGRNGTIATPPIEYWLQGWIERNKCDNMTEVLFNGSAHHFTWTCDGVQGAMQHYRVEGMGHVWPSTEPNFSQVSSGGKPTVIEANDLILRFFDRWDVEDRGTSPSSGGVTTTRVGGPSATETGGNMGTTTGANPGATTTTAGGGNAAGRVEGGMWSLGVAALAAVLIGAGLV
ncbi:hypothetical protein TWF730_006291 [Orbilia blumenaviensis]|uniref:feruloyl esterase n=1 Tax=Orbilia blumenaviensis TaxID=1796055 RepID=A0AAV9VGD2_9PEZI